MLFYMLTKFRRRLQPLTRRPPISCSPTSDLFPWRKDRNWDTYFRIIDICSLFPEDDRSAHSHRKVDVIFFDPSGTELKRLRLSLVKPRDASESLLKISNLLNSQTASFGTFCVLHSFTPSCLQSLNCSIAERGYISFSHNLSTVQTYLHGNLDAVSRNSYGGVQLLGGSSILPRIFNIQYLFDPKDENELFIVNSTSKTRDFAIYYQTPGSRRNILSVDTIKLPSRGCQIVQCIKLEVPFFVSIKSRLVMARPIIFTKNSKHFNVFHA